MMNLLRDTLESQFLALITVVFIFKAPTELLGGFFSLVQRLSDRYIMDHSL